MDCTSARRLIDHGVAPGTHTPASLQLGFHLAQCTSCRAYREQQDALLVALLQTQAVAPSAACKHQKRSAIPSIEATSSSNTKVRQRPATALLPVARLMGAVLLVLLISASIWIGGIFARTQSNIAAMYVTTVAADTPHPTPGVTRGDSGIAVLPLTNGQPTATPSVPQKPPTALAVTVAPSYTSAPPETPVQPKAHNVVTATPWPTLAPAPVSVPVATATIERQAPPPGAPFTLLVLGNDRRPGETSIPRTDVVMLVRVDPQRGRVALLSFPRDLWVAIPGYGHSRINAAYVWGEVYEAEGGGLGLAKTTVSSLIGRPIDYVAMVDFQGFIGLIDSIGGVTVAVEKELDDPQFPTMDYGYTHAFFAPGPQHMDGITALTYSRIRHPDSDFARIRRQQAVAVAIGQRLQERGDLQNVVSADTITGALRGYVQTDMPQEPLLGALWALRGLNGEHVTQYTLDGDNVTFGVGDDRYAELPIPGAIESLVQRFYDE